jgi:hypothetical protein
MSDVAVLRLTISAAYRHGAEVLLADSGPLPDLTAVREALNEIEGAFETHSDLLFERSAELVVRLAERRFERGREPQPRQQRQAASRGMTF